MKRPVCLNLNKRFVGRNERSGHTQFSQPDTEQSVAARSGKNLAAQCAQMVLAGGGPRRKRPVNPSMRKVASKKH